MLATIFKWVAGKALGLFTGGTLDKLLDTIEKRMDDEVKKEEIKAEVTKTVVTAQANLMVGRTWWFQLFFVVPLGFHWLCLNFVSAVPQWGWTVHPLPAPFDEWAAYIISALFIVDGGKALLGRIKK
ncbi:hypothetical protein GOB43_17840 [Sinorhizobium meliloti]|uniref:hypothetical protein n=1 Tax=Rhizobium meliloti TaxID=382 RepID=UPI000FD3DD56|nr:hypothetical protein [Sinorhizobium meliloti]MDW9519126.1 hypothetical protein [Sinorhizobium meliloti]RVG58473.1 hypothetical protein CN224_15860 [Sinorhizobium meliloti]